MIYNNTIPPEHAILAILESSSELVSVFGGRIYPDIAGSQSATEYIVYHIIIITPSSAKQQISRADRMRIQVDTFAKTRDKASEYGLMVRRALENRPGVYAGVHISQIKHESYNGNFIEGLESYRASHDFILRIQNN